MMIQLLIIILLTSLLSGVLGMGGGMILMGALSLYLPIPIAIVVHGIIQLHSNAFRAYLNRTYIKWKILPTYLLGNITSFLILHLLVFDPSKKIMFLLLGSIPFIAFALKSKLRLNILYKTQSYLCGVIITALQIFAGSSGPILDLFFLKSPLKRQEIIATKAVTQTISHFTKILFYLDILYLNKSAPLLSKTFLICAILTCFLGSRSGKYLLDKIKEKQFHKFSRILLFTIGLVYLLKGANL